MCWQMGGSCNGVGLAREGPLPTGGSPVIKDNNFHTIMDSVLFSHWVNGNMMVLFLNSV